MRRGSGPRMVQFWIEYSSGGSTVPLYEYQCTKCNKRTEKIESVSGPHLKKCPHCGGKVERLEHAPPIQVKRSGWDVTDHEGKKCAPESRPSDLSWSENAQKAGKHGKNDTGAKKLRAKQ